MIDKAKLGFWDIFTYLLIGLLLTKITFVLLLSGNLISWDSISRGLKELGSLSIVFIPIISLILGMSFEPISNKVLNKLVKKGIIKKSTPRDAEKLLDIIKNNYLPKNLSNASTYRYCKAVVEQNFASTNINIFLSRFGFYRSAGTILLLLIPATIFLFKLSFFTSILSIIYLILSYSFLNRAQSFKGHIEYEVYYNFIAYMEDSKFKSSNIAAPENKKEIYFVKPNN